MPRPVPTLEHFKLLQSFGRNKMQHDHPESREQLWRMVCEGVRLPYIPHPEVVEAWMAYVAGDSMRTSLAVNGNVHPSRVIIGVLYDGKMAAAHTTQTQALLRRICGIFRQCFKSDEEFLEAMQQMCIGIIKPKKGGE